MADLRPQFNEEVVSHGHPTKADVTNRAWNVEHAEDGTHKILPGACGIKMWFYQNVAPTGWTIDATPSDELLAVKGGVQAYNAVGGTGAGTWTVAGLTKDAHTHTGPSHTHTGPSHTHAEGSLVAMIMWNDANDFAYADRVNVANWTADMVIQTTNIVAGASADRTTGTDVTGTTAAGGTGATGADGTGASGGQSDAGISSAGTWRPKARLGIICTKD